MDENKVIEVCLRGEKEGFRMIVEAYGAQMMALAMNILGNREDAEDVCQEAFIQAFQNLGQYDRQKSFRNWLFTILYRRCLDLLRKRNRFRRFISGLKEHLFLSSKENTLFWEKKKALNPCLLESLSPKEKAALTLWAQEGYTSEEIASILGCHPSTARVHLFLARKKIKAWLEKQSVSL